MINTLYQSLPVFPVFPVETRGRQEIGWAHATGRICASILHVLLQQRGRIQGCPNASKDEVIWINRKVSLSCNLRPHILVYCAWRALQALAKGVFCMQLAAPGSVGIYRILSVHVATPSQGGSDPPTDPYM